MVKSVTTDQLPGAEEPHRCSSRPARWLQVPLTGGACSGSIPLQARTANLGTAHGGDIDNVQRFPSLQAAATMEGAHSHLGTGSAHS